MKPELKRYLGYSLGLLIAVGMCWVFVKIFPLPPERVKVAKTNAPAPIVHSFREVPVDLDDLKSGKTPDLIVVTNKFTSLWRDILKTSFLQKISNEELLFYYDESETLLSLKGAIRRIAFERDMTILDEILAYILERPIQVAYWKTFHGRLDHYMGITKRSGLTDALTKLAQLILDDKQLRVMGKREVDGVEVEVFQLDYSAMDTLYFYTLNDELIFFDDYNLPLPTKELRKKFFREEETTKSSHTLFASGRFLTFGYQFFAPGLDLFRFSFDETKGWETALTDGKVLNTAALLKNVPVYPAFCSFAPFDSSRVKQIFNLGPEVLGKISEQVAVCWYEDSKIYSPLFVFQTKEPLAPEAVKGLFSEVVGSFEKGILTDEEKELRASQIEQMNNGETVTDLVKATTYVKPFDVVTENNKDSWSLVREVSSPYGVHEASKSKHAEDMRSKRFFKVTLSQKKNVLFFSADDRLVSKAISTLDKTYPSAQDTVKDEEVPLFLFDPARTATLLKASALESLPEGEEALFRESLKKHLFSAMEKLEGYKPILGVLGKEQNMWSELQWRTYSSR